MAPPTVPLPEEAASAPLWAWGVFGVMVLGMLAVDLLLFSRKAQTRGIRQAAAWTAIWIGMAIGFNVAVYFWMGDKLALEFTTAYLIEKSLSVDNIFIFMVIFQYFGVPTVYQHRVLFWGILGALVMRAIMIGAGLQLIEVFRPVMFFFAAFLVFTGLKLFGEDKPTDPTKTWAYRLTQRYVPLTNTFHEEKFFVFEAGRRVATPLFLVLCVVEATDLAFALDSIPACLGVSNDMFVIYTSNIFAIMGLRAMFFLLRFQPYCC